MGLLVDGRWVDRWYGTEHSGGRFQRPEAQFRQAVRADGTSPFAPEAGRYHLYVSLACPWAHRTIIAREILGLAPAISMSTTS